MTLLAAVEAYVQLKQSLGAVFGAERRILRAFARHLGDIPVDTLCAEACLAFCVGTTTATRFSERKHSTLRGFFAYLRARGHMTASPLREPPHGRRGRRRGTDRRTGDGDGGAALSNQSRDVGGMRKVEMSGSGAQHVHSLLVSAEAWKSLAVVGCGRWGSTRQRCPRGWGQLCCP